MRYSKSLTLKFNAFNKAFRTNIIFNQQKYISPFIYCRQTRFYNNENHSKKNKYMNYVIGGGISFGIIYSAINIFEDETKNSKNLDKNIISHEEKYKENKETSENKIVGKPSHSENSNIKSLSELISEENIELPNEDSKKLLIKNEILDEIYQENKIKKPSYAQYLIVGGGTAAVAAFKAIKANDPKAKILIVTEEHFKPYMRPPLSKEMWYTEDDNLISQFKFKERNGNEKNLFYMDDEFYTDINDLSHDGAVSVLTDERVIKIDTITKKVVLESDWEINFDKCLIATGGSPKNLDCFEKPEIKDNVILFRNVFKWFFKFRFKTMRNKIEDFKKLKTASKQGKTIAIIGGGFLGSELACSLSYSSKQNGSKIIQIFPESGNLRKVLPKYLSQWVTEKVKEDGVKVINNFGVKKAEEKNGKILLTLENKNPETYEKIQNIVEADYVVVAIGIEPNVKLGIDSNLEIDSKLGGYLVNAELQARNSLWVAGDAACFYDIKLGRRRVEHYDHAVVTGRLAGGNMTGLAKPYLHQSMFWSDVGTKIGFEAIGIIDSSLKTLGFFVQNDLSDLKNSNSNERVLSEYPNEKYERGIIFYLDNQEKVVGILTWNLFNRMPIARKVLNEQFKLSELEEVSKLFKINYEQNSN